MTLRQLLLTVAIPFALLGAAQAQNLPAPGATGGPVISATPVSPPPAGFDVLRASAAERAHYAIPPAPDANANPKAYADWEKAVGGPKAPAEAPALVQTHLRHGPVQLSGPLAPAIPGEKNATGTSSNWSGPTILDTVNKPFKLEAMIGVFTVPTAQQAFGACTGGWDYSSFWAGLDGWGSNDVLQGGFEADAYCSGGTKSAYYSSWVEWFPYGSVRVSVPSVAPGNSVFVEVWNTSATTGYVYLYNYTTHAAGEYYLTAYPGYPLVGTSAEWIVERPSVGGSLATLTNYISDLESSGYAWNYTSGSPTYYYLCNASPTTGTWYMLTMLDNSGNGISTGFCENSETAYMYDYGSAY